MQRYLIAIDPGSTMSGICIMETESMKPLYVNKLNNDEIIPTIRDFAKDEGLFLARDFCAVIERIEGSFLNNYSQVYVTCEWVGRFIVYLNMYGIIPSYVYRHEEYKALCGNIYSRNDKGIRTALSDRFAYGQPNYGKGTKKQPGWFYGFGADMWAAYAVGVTYIDNGCLHRSWRVEK